MGSDAASAGEGSSVAWSPKPTGTVFPNAEASAAAAAAARRPRCMARDTTDEARAGAGGRDGAGLPDGQGDARWG